MAARAGRRPNLSALALVSFIGSFIFSRAFTTLSPKTVVITYGFHIHHFWYGLIMLAIGGWLGISYNDERIDRLAAILFGAGGGIIGDEAGLLLTMGDYWTELTYTVVITFLAVISVTTLLIRYSGAIRTEFAHFTGSNASLYFGVFLAAVSAAIILETDDFTVDIISILLTGVAFAIILAYFAQRISKRRRKTEKGSVQ